MCGLRCKVICFSVFIFLGWLCGCLCLVKGLVLFFIMVSVLFKLLSMIFVVCGFLGFVVVVLVFFWCLVVLIMCRMFICLLFFVILENIFCNY